MDKNLRSIVLLITAGTIAWLIAGAVFLVLGSDTKYVWTCVCGAALGVGGVRYTLRRSRTSGI